MYESKNVCIQIGVYPQNTILYTQIELNHIYIYMCDYINRY